MIWNTIAHPKMMEPTMLTTPSGDDGTLMPLRHVSTGKQNVYDLILNISQLTDSSVGPVIAYGDYDDLCAKLVRGELILCISVALTKSDNVGIRQDYSPLSTYKKIAMMSEKTIHGKPVILVTFDNGSKYIIDCNNTIYVPANAPFDPVEPAGDPDVA